MIPKSIVEKISLRQSGKIHLINSQGVEILAFYMRMGELLSELDDKEFRAKLRFMNWRDLKWVFAPENLPYIGLFSHSWRLFLEIKKEQEKEKKYKKGALHSGDELNFPEFLSLCQFIEGRKIETEEVKVLEKKGYLI